MSEMFTLSVLVAVIASGIRLATPYLLAALGEVVGQRSGVLNLGVDGVMLLGAFGSYWVALRWENLWLAAVTGILIGLIMGAAYAVVTLVFQAEQGISGIGFYLFGLGLSELLFEELVGSPTPLQARAGEVSIPVLSDVPYLGEALFQHDLVTYAAFLFVPVVWFLLTKTTFGLNVRAVGENPQAADTLGVSVMRTRLVAILFGSAMAGLAGAALTLSLNIFQHNITQGRGFIAVALVYFGSWRPRRVMIGALLYGMVGALVFQLKARQLIPLEGSDMAAMAPALVTIVALVFLARRVNAPAALTRPFSRG